MGVHPIQKMRKGYTLGEVEQAVRKVKERVPSYKCPQCCYCGCSDTDVHQAHLLKEVTVELRKIRGQKR